MTSPRFVPVWLALFFILLATWNVYWPGATGTYLLDDTENLKVLALMSSSPSLWETTSMALAQHSGLGRILPTLSFALQHGSWPHKPGDMISINIMLHLLNGLLIYLLSSKLAQLSKLAQPWRLALFATACWLLHPLQVSGTLYIIQRINQMSAFFVLAGLFTYLHGRSLPPGTKSLIWMSAGLTLGGGVALMCKENGALLPLLILVVEGTLLHRLPAPASFHWWRRIFLYVPIFTMLAFIAWHYHDLLATYARRDFTLVERLLSEPRILIEYLRIFFLPRAAGLGLFHDDEAVTRLPLSLSDILYISAILAALGGGLVWRKRQPVIAFGALWFLAGHALESSVIPLELYFEHRNYLPLFGLSFAVAALLSELLEKNHGILRIAFIILGTGWLTVSTLTTYSLSKLWGRPDALAEVWSNEHPTSARASSFQANMLYQQGFVNASARYLQKITEQNIPAHPEYYGEWLLLACDGRMEKLPDANQVSTAYATIKYSTNPVNSLSGIADKMEQGLCPAIDPTTMASISATLRKNVHYVGSDINLRVLQGRFLELAGHPTEALPLITSAYQDSGDFAIGFIEVRLLNSMKCSEAAFGKLDALRMSILQGGVSSKRYLPALDGWRRQLNENFSSHNSECQVNDSQNK